MNTLLSKVSISVGGVHMCKDWLSAKELEELVNIPSVTIKRYIRLHPVIIHKFDVHYHVHKDSIDSIKKIRAMYEQKRNADYINLYFEYERIKKEYEALNVAHSNEQQETHDIDDINKRENRFLVLSSTFKKRSGQKSIRKKTFFQRIFKTLLRK